MCVCVHTCGSCLFLRPMCKDRCLFSFSVCKVCCLGKDFCLFSFSVCKDYCLCKDCSLFSLSVCKRTSFVCRYGLCVCRLSCCSVSLCVCGAYAEDVASLLVACWGPVAVERRHHGDDFLRAQKCCSVSLSMRCTRRSCCFTSSSCMLGPLMLRLNDDTMEMTFCVLKSCCSVSLCVGDAHAEVVASRIVACWDLLCCG